MPRVTVGTKEIVVNFEHGTAPSLYNGQTKRPETDYTKCVILAGDVGSLDGQKSPYGEAVVRRYYKDPTNRKLARVNSLDLAMERGGLTKEERAALWATIRK